MTTEVKERAWPDYETLRAEKPFGGGSAILFYLGIEALGMKLGDFNLKPDAGIKVFTEGKKKVEELYGTELEFSAPTTPPVSYGHINCLGVELNFPENGEVSVDHNYGDVDIREVIDFFRQKVDFASSGMAPFFMDYHKKLQEAFPEQKVKFFFKREGPATTAYLMRGDKFFTDLFDYPEEVKELFAAIVDSSLEFEKFMREYEGKPIDDAPSGGFTDDIAAMIPPHMYDGFVVPYWERLLSGLTSGTRHAHVEDLTVDHLPYLEKIGLSQFDPSVSPKINPQDLYKHCRVPFAWKMFNFHYNVMTVQDIKDFIYQAAADGACGVFGPVSDGMYKIECVEKALTFNRLTKEVTDYINGGGDREKLREKVSEEGKKKFWDHWPE
ncbi:MAG: uroporphyrinogen decarboxylase family protein [Planctomycetota bacterium]|jgi:hypothetical protein